MEYVWFSVGFVVIHVGAYIAAGVLSLASSQDLYTGEDALLAPLLRDVSEESERLRQGLLLWPAQVTRGLIMSVVLYPVLPALGQLAFGWRTAFFTGLMFVYTDLAAATPFPNTIEGLVYLRPHFVRWDAALRIGAEAVIYSLLFGVFASWLLF